MRFRCQGWFAIATIGALVSACGGGTQQGTATAGGAGSDTASASGAGGGTQTAGGGHAGSAAAATGGAGATTGGAGPGGAGGVGGAAAGGGSGGGGMGGSGAGGVDSSGAAQVKMLQPTVDAFCAAARSCCAKQTDTPVMLDDCEAAFPANNTTVASLASGAVSLDATALAKCLAAYQAAATTCAENPVLDACRGVVQGKRLENAPCANGGECVRDGGNKTCLITEQNGTVGVCKTIPHQKTGDACNFTCRKGEECTSTTYGASDSPLGMCFEDDGVYCDYTGEPAKCKPVLALGTSCGSDAECGFTGYCDTMCKKRGTLGDPCTRCLDSLSCIDDKCASPPFTSGNTCGGSSLGPY